MFLVLEIKVSIQGLELNNGNYEALSDKCW